MATITTTTKNGSVGPSTFITSARYGTVERVRVKPRNPRTPAQETHRTFVAAVASSWRQRTDAQRAGWQALARLLPGRLNGYTAYVSVNVIRLGCGLGILADAPPTPALGTLSCTGLVVEATPLVKVVGLSATFAPDKIIVETCKPLSAGVSYVREELCQLTVVDGVAGPPADLDLTAAYVERYGKPKEGRRVVVQLTPVQNGFKGDPLQCRTLVAAKAP